MSASKAKRTKYGKSVSHTKLAVVAQRGQLAGPFVRLLRARQLRLWGLGEFVANTMSCGIDQSYGANAEAARTDR